MSMGIDNFAVASRTGNGNWNAIRLITNVDATDNAQSDKQVVISLDAKADDLATSPKNYLVACEVYGSNDGFKTWFRAVYANCYIDGSGNNLKYLSGTRQNDKWCTLSYTMTLNKLTSGSWGTYNEYRYGVAVYTTNNNTGHTISVQKIKMEYGSVATSWSPAPEDISVENIYTDGTTTIDGGKITTGSITADQIYVEDLYSLNATIGGFEINKNSIHTISKDNIDSIIDGVYLGDDGVSIGNNDGYLRFFKQDDGSYSFDILCNSIDAKFKERDDMIKKNQDDIDNFNTLTSYIRIATSNSVPCIELGSEESGFKLRITNTEIDFIDDDMIPAYISNQALNINRAIVKNELQIGGYIIKERDSNDSNLDNGNIGFSWRGVD